MKLCSLAIIAVFGLALLAGCPFLGKARCGDSACFVSAISACSDATYSEELSGATASYETRASSRKVERVTMALHRAPARIRADEGRLYERAEGTGVMPRT